MKSKKKSAPKKKPKSYSRSKGKGRPTRLAEGGDAGTKGTGSAG